VNPDTVDPLDTLEGKNLIYNKIQPVKKRVKQVNRSRVSRVSRRSRKSRKSNFSFIYTYREETLLLGENFLQPLECLEWQVPLNRVGSDLEME